MILRIREGNTAPYKVNLETMHKDVISFGRNPECDIVLKAPHVSRVHGCIFYEKGRWYIQDMESSNGVFFNDQKIKKHPLNNGDVIKLYNKDYDNRNCVELYFYEEKVEKQYAREELVTQNEVRDDRYSQPISQPVNMEKPPLDNRVSGLAIASMVLGILAVLTGCCAPFFITIILAVPSLIFAGVALKGNKRGRGMAIAGLACSLVSLIPAIFKMVKGVSTAAEIFSFFNDL